MNNSLSRRVPRLREPGPALQLLASVTLVFLLAFGADVLLQWAVGLFVAGIVGGCVSSRRSSGSTVARGDHSKHRPDVISHYGPKGFAETSLAAWLR